MTTQLDMNAAFAAIGRSLATAHARQLAAVRRLAKRRHKERTMPMTAAERQNQQQHKRDWSVLGTLVRQAKTEAVLRRKPRLSAMLTDCAAYCTYQESVCADLLSGRRHLLGDGTCLEPKRPKLASRSRQRLE